MTEKKAEATRLSSSILETFSTDSPVKEIPSEIPSEQTCPKQDYFNETQQTLCEHRHQRKTASETNREMGKVPQSVKRPLAFL